MRPDFATNLSYQWWRESVLVAPKSTQLVTDKIIALGKRKLS